MIVKAAKGGGGKGMRVVNKKEDLVPYFNAASSEALASFGDGGCFIERYVRNANHVEVQVVGDGRDVVHRKYYLLMRCVHKKCLNIEYLI